MKEKKNYSGALVTIWLVMAGIGIGLFALNFYGTGGIDRNFMTSLVASAFDAAKGVVYFILGVGILGAIVFYILAKGYDPTGKGLDRLPIRERFLTFGEAIKLGFYRRLLQKAFPDFNPLWLFNHEPWSREEGFSEKGTLEYEYERLKVAMLGMKMLDNIAQWSVLPVVKFKYTAIAVLSLIGIGFGFYQNILPSYMHLHPSIILTALAFILMLYNFLFVNFCILKPAFFDHFLPDQLVTPEQIEEVEKHLHETLFEVIPEGCPEDLCDRRRVGYVDVNGSVVDGQVMVSDLTDPILYEGLEAFVSDVQGLAWKACFSAAVLVFAVLFLLGV